jgi:hypothetical protein
MGKTIRKNVADTWKFEKNKNRKINAKAKLKSEQNNWTEKHDCKRKQCN